MTNNLRPFLNYLFIYIVFVMCFAWLVFGCSAEYHVKRATAKGYVNNVKIDTLKVPYFVKANIKGKDTTLIQYRDSLIFQTQTQYLTRWKVRFDNKRFADSLKFIRTMYADSLRYALKSQKTTVKHDIKVKKQTRKVVQSKNKNGFADAMKWVALSIFGTGFIILLFIVIRAIKRYILLNG